MQITASLTGSTATIALNGGNTNTTLTIKDASNLAADLAAFASDGVAVDRLSSTLTGTIPPTRGIILNGAGIILGDDFSPGFSQGGQRNQDVQVHPRGYILNPTDDGVQIITPAGTGQNEAKVIIPHNQIASIITQLNA